ncbi:MAG TPA: DUF417 family protein [Kofleriaceae bacterium]|nr:DUF417 family protein [Kofleriaceae bacterium]
MSVSKQIAVAAPLSWSEPGDRAHRLKFIGIGFLRYGVVFLLVMIGLMKFTKEEAEGIKDFVANSPFMSWMYGAFGEQGASNVIGVIEIIAGVLMALRRWKPGLSGIGSLMASVTFLVTLSFLFTTPNALAPNSPYGGFLMKDIVLFGAALYTAGEALLAAAARKAA